MIFDLPDTFNQMSSRTPLFQDIDKNSPKANNFALTRDIMEDRKHPLTL